MRSSAILSSVLREAFVALAIALGAAACNSAADLVPAGGECNAATDCEQGLACIPRDGGSGVCSSDLNSVQTEEDASMADGAARMNKDAAPTDDAMPTDDATPPDDANMPPMMDANMPPMDAAGE
jgi:hypothetical protein